MSSYYSQYSNTNPDGSPVTFWQALKDVVTHPIDTARAFIGAPIALIGGAFSVTGESVSGIKTEAVADLPGAQKLADVLDGTVSKPELPETVGTASGGGLPLWIKITAGAAAVLAVVVVINRELRT